MAPGRRDDSRSRSRGRGRNNRGRSRSRLAQHQRPQDSLELPRSWNATPNLARQVISNKFTRDLQIDGMEIFDICLAQVMTGGLTSWGLRSLANGKHTVGESFRSRQEAITAGTLMRSLRGDSSAQSAGADLNASLTHMTKNMLSFPCRHDWRSRR